MQNKEKLFLSINDASECFSIGQKSMRRYAEDGYGIFAIHVGERTLISPSRFEAYLLDRKLNRTTEAGTN